MYKEISQELQSEFKEIPYYTVKYNDAYNKAVAIVGTENAEKIKAKIRELLNIELEKYLKSKPKTKMGKIIRFFTKMFR